MLSKHRNGYVPRQALLPVQEVDPASAITFLDDLPDSPAPAIEELCSCAIEHLSEHRLVTTGETSALPDLTPQPPHNQIGARTALPREVTNLCLSGQAADSYSTAFGNTPRRFGALEKHGLKLPIKEWKYKAIVSKIVFEPQSAALVHDLAKTTTLPFK